MLNVHSGTITTATATASKAATAGVVYSFVCFFSLLISYQRQLYTYLHVCPFLPHGRVRVHEQMCLYCFCVSDPARLCGFFFFTFPSVRPSVGLLRGGLLAVKRPRDVRVGAGSQHPLLQEEVPGVGQVRGAPLPPGRQRVLLAHGSAAHAALEQLAHRCV